MHSAKVLSILALAATTIAAPHRGNRNKGAVVYKTVVHTAYETVIAGQSKPTTVPKPAPKPSPVYSTIVVDEITAAPESTPSSTVVVEVTTAPEPAPSSAVVEAPIETSSPEPVPSSTVVVEAPAETVAPVATGYMAIVDEYRVKLGLTKLAQNSQLEANALKTAQDGNGQMVHQLLEGSFGQVLAPGEPEDFRHVFVGGWLCERPDLPGLGDECVTAKEGWMHDTTGHADLLVSDAYSTIGCANAGGIWACDLGY